MTPQEKFKLAHARGMQASPFASTIAAPLYLLTGTTRHALPGCIIKEGDNGAKAEEYGLDRKFTLEAQIPKTLLRTAPHRTRDKLEYAGRIYDLDAVTGDATHSPIWRIEASAPRTA